MTDVERDALDRTHGFATLSRTKHELGRSSWKRLFGSTITFPAPPRSAARTLYLASERITVRELIARRVEGEVATHNATAGDVFAGLVQPTDSRQTPIGYRLTRPRRLDPAEQVRIALEAFERRGFIVLFDEAQVDDLDAELVLTGENEITFLKLVPLVGG